MQLATTCKLILLSAIAITSMSCTTKSIIVSGESTRSNEEAMKKAQTEIVKAEKEGCQAQAIGSGAGTGVGVGLGKGLVIGDNCPECDRLKKEQRELVEKQESVFVIHVLMRCPVKP